MMDERETDRLLSELFQRNAPYVDESAFRERVDASLLTRRRRRRRTRIVRAVALGFASVVLAGGVALGVYEAVDYFQKQPALVITDLTSTPGDGSIGAGAAGTSQVAGLLPVVGTATLEQVKSEGTSDTAAADGTRQVRGQVRVYTLTMSQRGISGTLEMTIDLTVRADGGTDTQGSWVLTGSQGIWKSSYWKGYLTPDGGEEFGYGQGSGTEGFEGLTLYLQWHSVNNPGSSAPSTGSAESITVTGWVELAK